MGANSHTTAEEVVTFLLHMPEIGAHVLDKSLNHNQCYRKSIFNVAFFSPIPSSVSACKVPHSNFSTNGDSVSGGGEKSHNDWGTIRFHKSPELCKKWIRMFSLNSFCQAVIFEMLCHWYALNKCLNSESIEFEYVRMQRKCPAHSHGEYALGSNWKKLLKELRRPTEHSSWQSDRAYRMA